MKCVARAALENPSSLGLYPNASPTSAPGVRSPYGLLARRRDGRAAHGRVLLAVGGFALAAAILTGIGVGRGFDVGVSRPPPQVTATVRTAEAPIILAGMGSQTTDPFYLAGGTYRSNWSAWGVAPEYPPCTHSAELMAVDPGNAETSLGHVTDLANLVHVPATGASDAKYVYNVKPGDYYLNVTSACGWQIGLTPT